MPPTLYEPVALPPPLPALIAETEITLDPFSMLDTETVPPVLHLVPVPRAFTPQNHSRSRAATPLPIEVRMALQSPSKRPPPASSISRHISLPPQSPTWSCGSSPLSFTLSDYADFSDAMFAINDGHNPESSTDLGVLTLRPEVDPDSSKIPAPRGAPGHPGSGGYSLWKRLEWSAEKQAELKVRDSSVLTRRI